MATDLIQTLHTQLNQLRSVGQQANPDSQLLQQRFLEAQQQFQTQVLPLGDRADAAPNLQPILTEMNRTFRLLGMDVAFLQAARQSVTAQQRQQQLGDKLQRLLDFCQALADTGL
ncbi:MAG: hypothetical protein EA342_02715 [Leptolyngbya sp. LCM1.Bin17]|nr:MAG: hypothetical protein EA342_02715 [Leptolyngbya sp. LCM1.Bin17]